MKNILKILIIVSICFTSCELTRPYKLIVCSGSGFTYQETWVRCDSFQMISTTEANIWCDGRKMHIIGERGIRPDTNF
jgi:hypothetical protein